MTAEPELLTYAALTAGRTFPTRFVEVTEETVSEYIAVTGDDAAVFRGPGAVVPPGLAGVWARLSYADGRRLPPGGFMARQTVHLLGATPVGRLGLSAEVSHRGDEDRREVTLNCVATDAAGTPVIRSTIDARWGQA